MSTRTKKVVRAWRTYTEEEINTIKQAKCCHCGYAIGPKRAKSVSNLFCYFILITGHRRGCTPAECTHDHDYVDPCLLRKVREYVSC